VAEKGVSIRLRSGEDLGRNPLAEFRLLAQTALECQK